MIVIGLYGAAGAMLRLYISNYSIVKNRDQFPLGTFVINSIGSLALGILFCMYTAHVLSGQMWNYFGVGFLGAFTTFSTFSYEWISYIQKKQNLRAARYVFVSVLLGVMMAALGYYVMDFILN